MQILLMAGGGGTRLWPLSTEEKPKQFQALFDDRSLLRTTFERVISLTASKNIWLSGNAQHQDLLRQELPEIPEDNFILEPAKRDNAAAICLSLLLMKKRGISGDEVIIMLPTDHRIENEKEFQSLMTFAEGFLEKNPQYLLTIGINPTHPETGYGYIHHKSLNIYARGDFAAIKVDRFVEKPDLTTAKKYLQTKNYLWNSGIYLWTLDQMLHWFENLLPNIYHTLQDHLENWQKIYPAIDANSLDYGISEKISDIVVIPDQNLGWSDVGDFRALGEHVSENIKVLDVEESYIRNDTETPMKVIGVKNIVIVNSPNGLLICDRSRAQDIKKLSQT